MKKKLTWKGDRCFCGEKVVGAIIPNYYYHDDLFIDYHIEFLNVDYYNPKISNEYQARKAVEERWEQFCRNISIK